MPVSPLTSKTWRPAGPVERLDVLIVGDTAFGENYQERRAAAGRENVLAAYGYDYGFQHLDDLLDEADLVVANLETPLTALRSSPFADVRPYLHYSDPDLAPKHLLAHGIRAVTLANNHMPDFGESGLLDTLQALEANGLIAVGAGRDEREAHQPLRIRTELTSPGATAGHRFGMSLYSVFRGGRHFEVDLRAYATAGTAGSAQLQTGGLVRRIGRLRQERPDEFVVVVPHWRRDYRWRSQRQATFARAMTGAGADLVVGHGSHMLQEIERVGGRWVVHGLGNFIFNSPGRYRKLGAPPYSLLARLTISSAQVLLRLYPIVTDNRRTGYQPRPVTASELREVWDLLVSRTNAPAEFRRDFEQVGEVQYPHLAVVIAERGRRAGAPAARTSHGSRAAVTAPTPPAEADLDGNRRPSNTRLVAEELKRRGIGVTWLDRDVIIADAGGVRLGYGFSTSHAAGRPGVKAAQRRDLARSLLTDAGIAVPEGRAFDGDKGAPEAAEYALSLGRVVLTRLDSRSLPRVVADANVAGEFGRAWARVVGDGGARVLVEKQVTGAAATFLVVGGRCVGVTGYSGPQVSPDRGRRPGRAGAVHLTEVHRSVTDAAARAARTFPGLDVAGITIAAPDLSQPCRTGGYAICDVDPRPALARYSTAGMAGGIAAAVVDLHLGPAGPARAASPEARQPAPRIAAGAGSEFPPVEATKLGSFYRVDNQLIALELVRRGAEVTWLSRNFLVADVDGARFGYSGTSTHATGRLATMVASRKDLTRRALSLARVEIVEGRAFREDEYGSAAEYARQLADVVVKPVDGNKGRGVTVGVRGRRQFRRAWNLAARRSARGVLVERRFPGTELRCLVVNDQCVAVTRRVPPHVIGNGRDTVEELVAAKNELRRLNPSLFKCPIRIDSHRIDQVRRQGYEVTDVLPDGELIVLDHKAGISTGGENVDLTDEVHPSLKAAAVRAARAIPGLDVAGVDLITADPRRRAGRGNYIICEVNSDPGIDIHHFPMHGTPRDVAGAIVDFHLSQLGIPAAGGAPSAPSRRRTFGHALRRLLTRRNGRAAV